MTRSRCHRWCRAAAGMLLLLGVADCASNQPRPPETRTKKKELYEQDNDVGATAPASLGGPFEPTSNVAPPKPPRPTPALTVPLTNGMNDASFLEDLKQLYYDYSPAGSGTTLADCLGGANPCGGGIAAMYIEPEVGMEHRKYSVDPLDPESVPVNGIVVARIINYSLGSGAESKFGFPAHQHSWWVVDRGGLDGALRSRFFTRDYATRTLVQLKKASYDYTKCEHTHGNRPAMAKWWDCADSEDYSLRARQAALPALAGYIRAVSYDPFNPGARPMTELGGSWVTCAEGCCTSGNLVRFDG